MKPTRTGGNEVKADDLPDLAYGASDTDPPRPDPGFERSAQMVEDWVLAVVRAGVVFPAPTDADAGS